MDAVREDHLLVCAHVTTRNITPRACCFTWEREGRGQRLVPEGGGEPDGHPAGAAVMLLLRRLLVLVLHCCSWCMQGRGHGVVALSLAAAAMKDTRA